LASLPSRGRVLFSSRRRPLASVHAVRSGGVVESFACFCPVSVQPSSPQAAVSTSAFRLVCFSSFDARLLRILQLGSRFFCVALWRVFACGFVPVGEQPLPLNAAQRSISSRISLYASSSQSAPVVFFCIFSPLQSAACMCACKCSFSVVAAFRRERERQAQQHDFQAFSLTLRLRILRMSPFATRVGMARVPGFRFGVLRCGVAFCDMSSAFARRSSMTIDRFRNVSPQPFAFDSRASCLVPASFCNSRRRGLLARAASFGGFFACWSAFRAWCFVRCNDCACYFISAHHQQTTSTSTSNQSTTHQHNR
jgi:hypothetical protein